MYVCVFACARMCVFVNIFFQFKITYAPWPTSPYHDSFYDDYVYGRPYEHQYRFIREKTLRNTSSEERHADNERVFKNFLGVHVYLDQHLMTEYREKPELGFAAYLSQLGGTLNLYAGITVVVIIELVEMFYRILGDCCKKQEPMPANV